MFFNILFQFLGGAQIKEEATSSDIKKESEDPEVRLLQPTFMYFKVYF